MANREATPSSSKASRPMAPLQIEVDDSMLVAEIPGKSQTSTARKRFSAVQTPSGLLDFPSWDALQADVKVEKEDEKSHEQPPTKLENEGPMLLTNEDILMLQQEFADKGKRSISASTKRASQQFQPKMKRKVTPDLLPSSLGSSMDNLTAEVSHIELASYAGVPSRIFSRATDGSAGGSAAEDGAIQTIFSSGTTEVSDGLTLSMDEALISGSQSPTQAAARRQRRMQIRSVQRRKQGWLANKASSPSTEKGGNASKPGAAGLRESAKDKEQEKELLRLRRNREAAMRSREEKKQLVQRLETDNENLTHQVSTLSAENKLLHARLNTLSALAKQCGVNFPSSLSD